MTKSLVEKAKSIPLHHRGKLRIYTAEEIRVAIAWAKDEVTYMQAARVLCPNNQRQNTINIMASLLREGFRRGMIKEAK